MAWADEALDLNRAIVQEFPVAVQYAPQNGSGPFTITLSNPDPPLLDNFAPGSSAGTSVLHLFGPMQDMPVTPFSGDQATLNGSTYVVFDTSVDSGQGVTLKLRRNA